MTATATAPATYTRGTKTAKVTTLRAEGHTLLTIDGGSDLALVAHGKTGAVLREVARIERVAPGAYEKNSRIVVHFTDGTHSVGYSSSQTWMAIVPTAASCGIELREEAPVAPLEVVTLDGEELAVEVTATTKAYRIGKLLRTWVLARGADSYDAALVAQIDAANVCYDGTSTLRVTFRDAAELSGAAADMEREHKAAATAAQRTLAALFA